MTLKTYSFVFLKPGKHTFISIVANIATNVKKSKNGETRFLPN